MDDNLTTNASNEAESPAFLVGAVSGSALLVMEYMTKHKCQLVCKYRYGLPQFRIYKDGEEKNYPRVNEETWGKLFEKKLIKKIGKYDVTGSIYSS